ncbi:hypothetical protein RY831_02060 [Noviherbaspirillum sp. CPCC 100848]|uniref:HTH cro/C1-type domain-containing protein n=1 Tax=Noviherbaspirillum album TaxID=3080276 RepID=A0ABU6J2R8_9BURK|nr:hypothetical protein [Noviherbaspirillum sp. CPCC 100848]MEC4717923.1 hypothetical protein [Noviherbaspirillum sp. CPCC 100848]
MKTIAHHPAFRFDPNRMLDVLLRRLQLANDDALCAELHVAPFVIARIRSGQSPIPPSLLIRINELSGINVRELRQLMGDRRREYRMGEFVPARQPAVEAGIRRRAMDADDAGLPSCVQWG